MSRQTGLFKPYLVQERPAVVVQRRALEIGVFEGVLPVDSSRLVLAGRFVLDNLRPVVQVRPPRPDRTLRPLWTRSRSRQSPAGRRVPKGLAAGGGDTLAGG